MIDESSLRPNWITKVAKSHGNIDPILIEKMVRALYLLELFQKSGAKFIFKGGTALSLTMQSLGRLSIDIDIIMPEKPPQIEPFLDFIVDASDFYHYDESKRATESKIDKAHYKFYYAPVTQPHTKSDYILLDILFDASPYAGTTESTAIESPLLQHSGSSTTVTVPKLEALLGDKLTAFAPNTTGVPYDKGKAMEIVKQLYDIDKCFDHIKFINLVKPVFNNAASAELKYRDQSELTQEDVLADIRETAICIATRGQSGKGNFEQLQEGIKSIRNYIYEDSFNIEKAMVPAAKAAYLSALIQTDSSTFAKFTEPGEITDWTIQSPFSTKLNKLKKTNPEAFFYWHKAFELMASL